MPQDSIFEIIQSLSKAEKRMFSTLHRGAKGKDWIQLFREMNNPKGYHHHKAVKKFKNEKAYYNARIILRKELDLFLLNQDSSPLKKLFNHSSLAHEYLTRQLYGQALENIKKGKKIAQKYEALDELGVLLNLEQSIPGRSQLKALRLEIEKYYQKRDQYEQIGILSRRLEGGIREVFDKNLRISLVDAVIKDAENLRTEGTVTEKAAFELNVLFRKSYIFKENFQKAILYSQEATSIYENKLGQLDRLILEKIIGEYSIQASLFSHIGENEGFINTIARINFFPIQFPGLDSLKVGKQFLPFLAHCLANGQYDDAVIETNKFRTLLETKDKRLIPKDLIRVNFFIAKLFFIQENARQANHFLNEFHSFRKMAPKIHSNIYPYAELMGIASLTKREIYEVANSRLKSLKRFLIREGLEYQYFHIQIGIFDHLIQFGSYYDPQLITKGLFELSSLEKEESSKRHFSYFDPCPFLISLLKKTPLKEAYLHKLSESGSNLSKLG